MLAASFGYFAFIAVWTILSIAVSLLFGALVHGGGSRVSRSRHK